MTTMTRIAATVLAFVVLATACSADDNDDSAASTSAAVTAVEQDYLDAMDAIGTELDDTVEPLFDAIFADGDPGSAESVIPELAAAIESAIEAEDVAVAKIEALDTPDRFRTDQARMITFMSDRRELMTRQAEAGRARDVETFDAIDKELEALDRALLADVSFEFGEVMAYSEVALASLTDLSGDDLDYLDAVSTAWDEFRRRVSQFGQALERSYGSGRELLQALLDAGAGEGFVAVRALVVEIDPPPTYEAPHQRLLEYLDETVRLDTLIAEAAAAGDVVAFEVANVELGIASGLYSLEVPPELAATSGASIEELASLDIPGGDYGIALAEELRRFRILALATPVSSGLFPSLADESVVAAFVEVAPLFIGLTQDSIDALAALDPPDEYVAGQARIADYLQSLFAERTSALAAGTDGDGADLRERGVLGDDAETVSAEDELLCAARDDLVDDPIWAIVEAVFEPPPGPPSAEQTCDA